MKNILIALLICLAASSASAQQQHIQDLSLSPAETAQQQNNSHGFQNDVSRRSDEMNTPDPITAAPSIVGLASPGSNGKSFMEGYCDPSFVSILANNRKYYGQEQCLKQIRDDACSRFKALPPEVKAALDDAIGCLFSNVNGYATDKGQEVANDSVACGASYMHRITMLKKYMSDEYASYALLFLPDDVLDTPGRCINRR